MWSFRRVMMAGAAWALLAVQEGRAQDGGAGPSGTYPASFFRPFHPNSALDMVRRVPGFTFQPGDPALRGMAESAGNVVIDGKRVADKTFALGDVLDRIPATQVDRIELIYGGTPGVDMLGQSMVANVVRHATADRRTAITLSSGLFGDGRVTPGLTVERSHDLGDGRSVSMSASLSRYVELNKGDGRRSRSDGAGRLTERARIKAAAGGTTGYAQATVERPGFGGQLRLNGTLTWTDYRDRQEDSTDAPSPVTTTLDEDLGGLGGGQAGGEIGVHLTRALGERLDSETTLSGRLGRKRFRSVSQSSQARAAFDERDRTSEVLGRTQLRGSVSEALSYAFDLEGAVNGLDTRSAFMFNDIPISLPNAIAQVTETRVEAGLTMTWRAAAFDVQGGVHFEDTRITARSQAGGRDRYRLFKPDLSLVWKPGPGRQARLRVERTVGQLDFANFIAAAGLDDGRVSAGNTALRPDKAWLAEVSVERRTRSGFALLLSYRHSWLRDVVDRTPVLATGQVVASFDAPGNIGGGREDLLRLDWTTPLSHWLPGSELKLNMAYRRSSVSDPTTGQPRRVSAQKPLSLTGEFHHDLPRLKAAWGVTIDSGWRSRIYRFDEIETELASTLLSVFVDYNPRPDLSLRLDVSDLLDRRFTRSLDVYGGGRNTALPLYQDERRLALGPAMALKVRRAF